MADEPICARCKVTSSLMWEKNKEGEVLCLECNSSTRQELASTASTRSEQPSAPSNETAVTASPTTTSAPTEAPLNVVTRRTRLRNAKGRYGKAPDKTKVHTPSPSPASSANSLGGNSPANTSQQKGGGTVTSGRRSLLKGKPNRAPAFTANVVTSDSILHKGTRYEVGDIVSILDEGGKVYYALLRGFLEDQYSEKYAVLTWLIPTVPNPKIFDPSLFVLGPEEDSPRDMECLDFVTHSPQSNSFLSSFAHDSDLARLWVTKRRRIVYPST